MGGAGAVVVLDTLTVMNGVVKACTGVFLCQIPSAKAVVSAMPPTRKLTSAGQNQERLVNGSICATASPVNCGVATSRSPHSRQYSCPGAVSAPQSGHIPGGSAGGPPRSGIAGSDIYEVGRPQLAQKCAPTRSA